MKPLLAPEVAPSGLFYYRAEIITVRSKSPTAIGDFEESLIIVFCWATDVRDAITVVEAGAAAQNVVIERFKSIVDLGIPFDAHIERPEPLSDPIVSN